MCTQRACVLLTLVMLLSLTTLSLAAPKKVATTFPKAATRSAVVSSPTGRLTVALPSEGCPSANRWLPCCTMCGIGTSEIPCFKPNDPIKRNEAAFVVRRSAGFPLPATYNFPFADVTNQTVGYEAIETLYNLGVVSGAPCQPPQSKPCFFPGNNLRRDEMAGIVRKAMQVLDPPTVVTVTPTNTPSSTNTPTITNTPTSTLTPTNTSTITNTPTSTLTPTNTSTRTSTPTSTPTLTPTGTPTSKPSNTPGKPTFTPTNTPSNLAVG